MKRKMKLYKNEVEFLPAPRVKKGKWSKERERTKSGKWRKKRSDANQPRKVKKSKYPNNLFLLSEYYRILTIDLFSQFLLDLANCNI